MGALRLPSPNQWKIPPPAAYFPFSQRKVIDAPTTPTTLTCSFCYLNTVRWRGAMHINITKTPSFLQTPEAPESILAIRTI